MSRVWSAVTAANTTEIIPTTRQTTEFRPDHTFVMFARLTSINADTSIVGRGRTCGSGNGNGGEGEIVVDDFFAGPCH